MVRLHTAIGVALLGITGDAIASPGADSPTPRGDTPHTGGRWSSISTSAWHVARSPAWHGGLGKRLYISGKKDCVCDSGVVQYAQKAADISGFGEKYLEESLILPKLVNSSHKVFAYLHLFFF